MNVIQQQLPDRNSVLSKAILRAAEQLGLNQTETGAAIGLHRTSISKLKSHALLNPETKEGELALYVIRIARALFALTGGDETWIKRFMRSHNQMTGGVPAEQIATISGLMTVLRYVDAIRGKV